MPAGRAAALEPDAPEEPEEPEEPDEPAEPAVLPDEADGDEPTVPLLLLPEDIEPGAWSLMVLVLTSQHWRAVEPPGLGADCCAFAATTPAKIAAEARRARLRFMRGSHCCRRHHRRRRINVSSSPPFRRSSKKEIEASRALTSSVVPRAA